MTSRGLTRHFLLKPLETVTLTSQQPQDMTDRIGNKDRVVLLDEVTAAGCNLEPSLAIGDETAETLVICSPGRVDEGIRDWSTDRKGWLR